ncbi:MAG: hypothetical protein LUG89_01295 [Methanosphaera sp.]|nr:hypothetical protein [Methanosphaera sp.]
MSEKKLTYDDLMAYQSLFTLAPSFLLGRYIKNNTNLVGKFSSQVESQLKGLNNKQKEQLDLLLESDVNDLQELLIQAYKKTHKKQFKQLAQNDARDFIMLNLTEIKKIV